MADSEKGQKRDPKGVRSEKRLAVELRKLHQQGRLEKKQMAMVIFFGIKFAKEISACVDLLKKSRTTIVFEIIMLSGIPHRSRRTYVPEILNGIKLAQYVEPR